MLLMFKEERRECQSLKEIFTMVSDMFLVSPKEAVNYVEQNSSDILIQIKKCKDICTKLKDVMKKNDSTGNTYQQAEKLKNEIEQMIRVYNDGVRNAKDALKNFNVK